MYLSKNLEQKFKKAGKHQEESPHAFAFLSRGTVITAEALMLTCMISANQLCEVLKYLYALIFLRYQCNTDV